MSSLLPVSWIFCFLLCLWTLPSGSSSTIKQVANDVSSAPQRLRHLAVGDFQELNEIIQDATIELPETSASGNMYSLRLYSIRCTDFSIGDVHLSSHQSSHTQIMLGMEITDFSMTCRARYHFTGFLVNNRGDVEVTSLGNDAVVIGKVLSTNLYEDPPTTVEIYKCDPTVNLNGMNFINGGIWGVLLNTAEGLLKRIMEPILEQRICSELQAIMLDVEVFLEYAKEILDEYDPQNSPVTDPLLSELIMNVPSSIQLLTLQDDVSRFGKLFQAGVEQAVEYMQAVVPDLANPSQFDLQANILLREYLLEDGALVIDLANDFSNIAILLQDHNTLTYTMIRLDSVRLVGLDTLTKFHPLDTIGSYTLKTQLSWEYLAFEMLATIEVKPSTLPDSIISGSGNTRILEKVNIFFGIDDLFADVSLLSALDQDALENIRLGSLLQKTNIMTCLLSSIFKMELSAFSVQANNILTPTMDGFVSTGLDRVFSEAMEATFKMYENILLNASPAYFQRTIRPMLNQRLLQDYIDDSQCADPVGLIRSPNKEKPIDFRDLLLPPDEALDAGATGQEPYGNLFSSFVIPELQEQFLQRANHFNQRFIRPLTLKQSGIEGTVQWEPDLLSYSDASWPDLYDRFEFSLSNLRVANLDTVMDPIKILEPNDKNILFNSIRLDSNEGKETLNLTMTLSILIDGDESPLQMENHLDISISIPATSLSLGIMTSIKEYSLLAFPLNDVTNIFCWLAAFGDLDANGDWVHSLDISSLSFWISSFFLDSTCLKCTSPGGGAFSEVLSEINRLVGSNQRLRNKIIHLVESMAWSLWNQFDMESLLADAPKYCPHLPDYDPESAFLTYQWPIVSSLPTEAMESILMLGAIAFQALLIVTAKNHLLADNHDNVFRMKKKRDLFDISGDAWVVDWTNLANDYGSWVEFAFEEFRTYLGEPVKERVLKKDSGMTIRANSLLREYVLDENAAYNMDLGVYGLNYETMGFAFSAHSLLIHGLDSITSLDVFIPKGPQTLENHFRLEKIQLEFQIKITTPEGRTDYMSLTYMVRDIVGQVDLDVVVDLQRLGDIQLGSIFNLDQILFCALSGLQSFQFSALRLSIGSLEYPLIEGFLSSENQEFLMWMMGSLVDKYRDDLVAAIPLIFGQTIRDIANALSAQIIGSMSKKCSLPEGYPETGMVDWRDFLLSSTASRFLGGSGAAPYGNLFSTIYDMVNEKIFRLGASNRPLINDLLRKVTERQSNVTGSILFRGKALESSASISLAGLTADIGLSLSDVAIDHLDSVGDPLDLFRPIDRKSNILKSVASFGVDSKPLSLTGTIILTLADGVEMNLRNEMKYSISFDNVVLMASTLLRVAENSLATFPLHDLDNVYCWLSTIISGPTVNDARLLGIGFVDTFFSIGNFSMDVSCTSCTSPDFDDLILSLYAVENVTELENNIREKAGSLLEAGFVQDIIDQVVRASAKQCPHRVEYDPNATLSFLRDPEQTLVGFMGTGDSVTKTPWFNIANTVVAGCIFVFGVLCRWLVNRRNKKWVKSLTREGAFLLEKQHEKERKMEVMLETYTSSLFRSPHIPRNIQWGVPIALIVNIGLYMGAHLGTLSVVNIDASLGGESFTIYDFLEFTFIGSTIQTYNNGGAEMAILIWIFTGFWPYLKLLVSLLLWMLPPGRLSVARRGRILLWIDTLATLSAVDIIVMLLGLALLLVFVGGPDEALSAGGVLYSTKAIVIPRAGFYCFIVAQRMSRVSSRFFLEYHERVLSMATRDYERKQRLVSSDGEEDGGSTIPANSNGNSQALNSSFENQSEDSGEILASEVDQASADRYRDEELPSSGMVTNKQLGSVRPISRDEDRATSPAEPERQDPSVREEFRWGTLGVIFGGITIFIVFIIGAIFAPSISLDASSVAGLAAESGKTYEEVVNEYGVFLVASGVLVKARFVLNTKFDFVGLLFLAVAAVVSIGMVFFIQAYQFIRRKIKERQFGPKMPSFGHKGCGLPSYICLQKWKHMEIYLISVAIGVWQLGSIASYAIHSYCDILGQVYDVFTYIGLVEASSAQCYRLQATLPGNLIIVCGSFVILILAFAFQATAQYRENVTESLRWIDGDDVPRLSLAWSSDKSKNKRYLHLIESLSFDQQYLEGDIHQPETPSTRATTPPGTPPRLICPTEFASPQSSNSFGFQTPPRGHCPQIPLRISNSNASRDASLLHARLEDDVLSTPSRSGFDMERLPSVMRDELSEAEDYVSVTWKDISHRTSRRTPSYLPSFGIPTRIDHAYEAASSSFGLPDFVHYSSSSYLRGTPSVITYDSAPPGSPSIADASDEIPSTPTRINHAGGGHSYFL